MQLQQRDATSELDCSVAVVVMRPIGVFAATDDINSVAK
jgi:hypothetical protein